MDDSTGRPETVSIPNVFGQPTPKEGIMKSVLQTKVVHLPVLIPDCTFLHHNQTTEKKKEHHVVLRSSNHSFLSLVCRGQSEIMFVFWKIFICLNFKKKKSQTLHI